MVKFGKYEKGSYTVEAAFIVPVILGLIFVIMYTIFLLHDRVVLQANLQRTLCLLIEEQIACEKEDYQDELEQMLWVIEIGEADISESVAGFSGKVKAEATLEIPVLTFFMESLQQVELEAFCTKLQPEMVKRLGG